MTPPPPGADVLTAPRDTSGAQRRPDIRTAKKLFVAAAGASFVFSVYLWFLVDKDQGVFVGLWVPSILSLGSLLLAGQEDTR